MILPRRKLLTGIAALGGAALLSRPAKAVSIITRGAMSAGGFGFGSRPSAPRWGTLTNVVSAYNTTPWTFSPTANIPARSLILISGMTSQNATTTIAATDTQLNTYTVVKQENVGGALNSTIVLLMAYNCNALTTGDVITIAPHATYIELSIDYIRGAKTTGSPLDTSSGVANGTASSYNSNPIYPSQNLVPELIIGVAGVDGGTPVQTLGFATPPLIYANLEPSIGGSKFVTSSLYEEYTADTGGGSNWAAIVAAFLLA